MASSSNHNFDGSIDDEIDQTFDQYFNQYFDQTFDETFEDLCNVYGDQEDERKTRKK